ncbi:2573_t:CDS:2 [Racocetra persica]|uniref:2573_t:CDS:1 n=1 Tax=Racocetra persica TaxID=160502 RepID=A0ACA9KC72_9GLOM|nr:2573_t:CDS:2 [Racocetra persica]
MHKKDCLINYLKKKKIEQTNIEIPVIQLPKRNKNQSSKLKLWELCSWLSKDYFTKIKADFTPHLEANQITELTTWSQLGHLARESWIVQECLKQKLNDRADNFRKRAKKKGLNITKQNIQVANSDNEPEVVQQLNSNNEPEVVNEFQEMDQKIHLSSDNEDSEFFGSNFYENCDGSTSDSYATSSSTSGSYIDPTSDSNNEICENILPQNLKEETQFQLSPTSKKRMGNSKAKSVVN